MFKIKQFVFNPFDESTFLLIDQATKKTLVVDPGMMTESEYKEFDSYIEKEKLEIEQLVNTHLHVDHCIGDNYVRDRYGVKVQANIGDADFGQHVMDQAMRFGLRLKPEPVTIDVNLKDGDVITVGESKLLVIQVPGHSQGGLALYCADQDFVISGDSLFQRSIGRTDFDGGNAAQLINAVKTKLLTLPDNTLVIPGHGPTTTIGEEKKLNPYLQ